MTDLIELLKKKELDAVLAENLDRLTRNASDIHKFYKIIRYYDLELYTVNEEKSDQITIVIKGTMNEIPLTDTADKVKRAQIERRYSYGSLKTRRQAARLVMSMV